MSRRSEAREKVAYSYFLDMLPDGWTATHTKGEYDRYDVTATDGSELVYVETKIRDYPADRVREEGAYVDEGKVDYLANLDGKAAIVQFFPNGNETYVWSVSERNSWKRELRSVRKNNDTVERVLKRVCVLPMDERHRRYTVDLTDYNERWHIYYDN